MHPLFTEASQTVSLRWKIYTFILKKTNKISGSNTDENGWWYTDFGLPRFVHPNSKIGKKSREVPITVENMNKTDRKIMALRKT